MKQVRIWDIPTRLFHWVLVILMGVSFYTGLSGGFVEMDYHMISGYCILALLLFRILWGLFGGYYSRFTTFVKGPAHILRHIVTLRQKGTSYAGHNPLGALSIIAIVLVLLLQTSTGLFANDDIMLEGPLTHLVSHDTSRMLSGIHKTNVWAIGLLACLHLCAIAFYQFYKKDRLLGAMITGYKSLEEGSVDKRPLIVELIVGALTLIFCAGLVYAIITYI